MNMQENSPSSTPSLRDKTNAQSASGPRFALRPKVGSGNADKPSEGERVVTSDVLEYIRAGLATPVPWRDPVTFRLIPMAQPANGRSERSEPAEKPRKPRKPRKAKTPSK